MVDWIISFIYFFGAILLGSIVVMGITTMRIVWDSLNGKTAKTKDIKLASMSFAVMGSLPIFMTCFVIFYQGSLIAVLLGLIGSIIVWIVLNIIYQKLMEGLVINNTEAYNKVHSDDLKRTPHLTCHSPVKK